MSVFCHQMTLLHSSFTSIQYPGTLSGQDLELIFLVLGIYIPYLQINWVLLSSKVEDIVVLFAFYVF